MNSYVLSLVLKVRAGSGEYGTSPYGVQVYLEAEQQANDRQTVSKCLFKQMSSFNKQKREKQ